MTGDEMVDHMRRMLDFALSARRHPPENTTRDGGVSENTGSNPAALKREEVTDMPVKSKAQSKFLNQKFGHRWVKAHHFGGSTKGLPQHKKSSSSRKK